MGVWLKAWLCDLLYRCTVATDHEGRQYLRVQPRWTWVPKPDIGELVKYDGQFVSTPLRVEK